MIIEDRLYLGGFDLYVYKVSTSLTQPLTLVTKITCNDWIYKMMRVANELLLGKSKGFLKVVDINTSEITHIHQFTEANDINDIIAIDDTHYLLAAWRGLLKTTKHELIKHYY